MTHKTFWLVIFWLVIFALLLIIHVIIPDADLPLQGIADITCAVSFAYVGIDKAKLVVLAAQSPRGEFGSPYVPPLQDKHLWVVIAWLGLCLLSIIIKSISPSGSPVEVPVSSVVTAAGILSTAYVALDKGAKVAAATGVKG